MITGDYQDLLKEQQERELHAVSIGLEGVEVLPDDKASFQSIFSSHHARSLGRFMAGHSYYVNYHGRTFLAMGTTATLRVSDWASADEPGGPIAQELTCNFIEVQPYYSSGDEQKVGALHD